MGHGIRDAFARRAAGLVAVLLVLTASSAGAETEHSEFHVEAAYLFNFARFVEWPSTAFAGTDAPFAVCVLGRDPFGSVLDETFAGEAIEGRKVVARRIGHVSEGGDCQILFVADRGLAATVRTALGARPVLTVGDDEAFAREGGMVGFRREGRTIRFDVNAGALRAAGLTASSQLLALARVVGDAP